ncbi:hypothetical protein [Clostridium polynesiense]|uniref:hypothetical protein n=1 Tax=Clostridium polynesiense TaxID=1325933 RepID=UPI00058E25F0|nr:hypothetical protein [Clostridium polynesiense]
MSTLVLWEVSKKQDYIFKSNRLAESIGASIIVKKLEKPSGYGLEEDRFIMQGGGNALHLFKDGESADRFIKSYSLNTLKEYPGVELFIVKEDLNLQDDDVKVAVKNAYKALEKKKTQRENSLSQAGFGIEHDCHSTGLPAVRFSIEDGDRRYISREVDVKKYIAKKQEGYFKELEPSDYEFSKEIEDLILEGEKSYISVVHIDGNSMGKMVRSIEEKIIKEQGESQEDFNQRYIKALKEFSSIVSSGYSHAFKKTCEAIGKYMRENKYDGLLPLRPLILAGDDVTFLCNSYVSVEASRLFLQELEKITVNLHDLSLGKLYACAGIATVKKGYPFIKAYELAEQLCQNAKTMLLIQGYENASALDFHIAQGDVNKTIYDIRQEDYKIKENEKVLNLTMKPLIMDSSKSWKNYGNFKNALQNINEAINKNVENEKSDIARSKIKSLKEAFKKGGEATGFFFKFYKIDNEKFLKDLQGTSGKYCFNQYDNTCMYLDAIEVMDIFRELKA